MRYCAKCGARLPEDAEAKFCPSCGTSLGSKADYKTSHYINAKARRERLAPSLRNRIALIAVVMVLSFIVTALGAAAKIEPSEAQDTLREVHRLEEILKIAGVQVIFGNNMMWTMVMFIPVLGPVYGLYVLYSTGRVLAAAGSVAGIDPLLLLMGSFIFPHAWIEYVAYGLAISESFWLVHWTIRRGFKGFREELDSMVKAIAFCAVLLLLAAFAEMYVLSFAPA